MGILRSMRRRLGLDKSDGSTDMKALGKRLLLLVPGYVGELRSASNRVTVTPAKEDLDVLASIGAANDRDALEKMTQEGRAWPIQCGTPCEVLESPSSIRAGGNRNGEPRWFVISLVRLLAGEHEGEACWVGAEFIR